MLQLAGLVPPFVSRPRNDSTCMQLERAIVLCRYAEYVYSGVDISGSSGSMQLAGCFVVSGVADPLGLDNSCDNNVIAGWLVYLNGVVFMRCHIQQRPSEQAIPWCVV